MIDTNAHKMVPSLMKVLYYMILTVATVNVVDGFRQRQSRCSGDIDDPSVCQVDPDRIMYWYSRADWQCYGIRTRQCRSSETQSAMLFEDRDLCSGCRPMDGLRCALGSRPIGYCNHKDKKCTTPGTVCKLGGAAFCCNATLEELAQRDYDSNCPSGAKKYHQSSSHGYPMLLNGLKCEHNFCPKGHKCVKGAQFSFCCESEAESCPEDLVDSCDAHRRYCAYDRWLRRYCEGTCNRELGLCKPVVSTQTCSAASKVHDSSVKNKFHAALTNFAFNIYRETVNIQGDDVSIFMSPISIAIALGMLAEAAAGETKRQLLDLLNAEKSGFLNAEQLKLLFHDYQSTAFTSNANYNLSIANKIYAENSYRLLPDFEIALSTCFKSAAERLDIMNDPEAARKRINRWVELQTKNKIKDMIPTGDLKRSTAMVLVNAIYFKADWHHQFQQSATRQVPFIKYGTPASEVPMMSGQFMQDEISIYEDRHIKAIRMQYINKELFMLVLLPHQNTRHAMHRLERWLSADQINNMEFASDKEDEIKVLIPKVKLELYIPLKQILMGLGAEHMFTNSADFSQMSRSQVKVSKAFHKAFIQVDEEGTEASAATAVLSGFKSGKEPLREFRADHPFMFAIVHHASGTPLFIGKYLGA